MLHRALDGSPIWRMADIEPFPDPGAHGEPARAGSPCVDALPSWAGRAYSEFKAKVLDSSFPCTFGTIAQRKGEVRYAFVEPRDPEDEGRLTSTVLTAFADLVRPLDPVTASLMPLTVFMPLPAKPQTVEQYYSRAWALLGWLHAHDPAPWPEHVPRDPDDSRWSFCFGGVPFFATFKTLAHIRRRSRRMASAYVVLFQAREGFDALAGTTPPGRRTRSIIRRKLAAYDDLPVPTALAHYGSPENREWQQYFAWDDDRPSEERCPFLHSSEP